MIRRSLIAFFAKYKDDYNLNLTDAEKSEIEAFLRSNRFHFILRNQIVMNPIPKRLKKGETEEQREPHENHSLNVFLERVSHYYYESLAMSHTIQMIHKTAIDGMGIFQLGMVQDFFKKMKIPLSEIQVNGEYFDLLLSPVQIRNLTRFNKIPSQSFLTKFNRKGFGIHIEFSH